MGEIKILRLDFINWRIIVQFVFALPTIFMCMARVYIIIGSNMEGRLQFLKQASRKILDEVGSILNQSSIYETEPWGFHHPNKFLNQVLEVETSMDPESLLYRLLDVEKILGRIRDGERYGSRTIDIDILFYNNLIINSESLIIPHPRLGERKFVLIPLCELIPSFLHPVLNKTVKQLLSDCKDTSDVRIFGNSHGNN
jgi:2-amino-4-hydroxy-6-hydroxymethyldihydropteridine diphosphokinase